MAGRKFILSLKLMRSATPESAVKYGSGPLIAAPKDRGKNRLGNVKAGAQGDAAPPHLHLMRCGRKDHCLPRRWLRSNFLSSLKQAFRSLRVIISVRC